MKVEPELSDFINLKETATAIIKKAKGDLMIWQPVLEQTLKQIETLTPNSESDV